MLQRSITWNSAGENCVCVCGGNFRSVAPKHLPLTYIIPNNISPASSPSSTRTLFPPSQWSRTEAARAELPFSTHATSALCVFYDDYAPSKMHFWRKRKKNEIARKTRKDFSQPEKVKNCFCFLLSSEDEKCFSFISRRSNFSFYIFHHASAAWRGNPSAISR